MQFGFSLSKKRTLVVMLGIAIVTSFMGSLISDLLRMPAVCAMAPVSDFVKASTSAFKTAMVNREEPVMSSAEASRLRREIQQLRSEAWARSQRERYWWDRYRRVQNTRKAYGASLERCELIPARVILGEALPYGRSQTVIKGTIHGVEPGMRVIDVLIDRSKALPAGDKMRTITGYSPGTGKPIAGSVLVGWVEAAGSFTARVRLVTDKRFKVEAWLHRTLNPANPRIITANTPEGPTEVTMTARNNSLINVKVMGDGERGLVTSAVPKSHNVRPGDWVWTIGRSAKLPVKLRIGKVAKVATSVKNPNFVAMTVTPAAELGSLRDVLIVRSLVSPLTGQLEGN